MTRNVGQEAGNNIQLHVQTGEPQERQSLSAGVTRPTIPARTSETPTKYDSLSQPSLQLLTVKVLIQKNIYKDMPVPQSVFGKKEVQAGA